jgi:uncharacterized protein (DUF1778 family)
MSKLEIKTNRTRALNIRVTDAEHEKFEMAAKALGLRGATAFVRQAALREAQLLTASSLEARVSKLESKT